MSEFINRILFKKYPVVKRRDLFFADLSPVVGSEQGGIRPVLVIQNNTGNKHSPTIIVAAITAQMHKQPLPIHVLVNSNESVLKQASIVLLEQIRTIDKCRLKEKIGTLSEDKMEEVNKAICISLSVESEL